jgi:DNA-binding NarL/FixJ family response regulator
MRILIVDDHALIREGMSMMLRAVKPDIEVTQATTCQGGLDAAAAQRFDMALLDLQLPDKPGFVALEQLRREQPELPVVIISGVEDRATVMRALDAGAKAFVPKSADANKTQAAMEALLSGRVYLPDNFTDSAAHAVGAADSTPIDLTERQMEVLSLLVAGLPNKLIARRLNIVESTVKIHVSAILRELRVTSRTQALIAVARMGITLPSV